MANTVELHTTTFDFTGNALCLDFANTLHDRSSTPRELLNSYTDLVQWGQEAGILSESEAEQLTAEAAHLPEEAEHVRQQAIELREAIYHIIYTQLYYSTPEAQALALLNSWLPRAMVKASHSSTGNSFTWDWEYENVALNRILWPIARSAAELLTGEELASVKMCAADNCNWLFLDTSKNHTRRWCDMKSCGNRAKVKRHYKKGRATE